MGKERGTRDIRRYVDGKQTSTYRCWVNMKQRCLNPGNSRYRNYGARGVKIYDGWLDYENFYEDMGKKPDGLALIRIDEKGDFEPGNCYWGEPQVLSSRNRKEEWVFAAIHRDGEVVAASSRSKFAKEYGLNVANVGRCLDGELDECGGWSFKKLTKGSDIELIRDAKLLF